MKARKKKQGEEGEWGGGLSAKMPFEMPAGRERKLVSRCRGHRNRGETGIPVAHSERNPQKRNTFPNVVCGLDE